MVNFVVFNELSLPISDQHWRQQLKGYIDVVEHLQKVEINTIRAQHYFKDLACFTENQSLAAFFSNLPREMQSRVRSLLVNQTSYFKTPLIGENNEPQHTEFTINSEYCLNGEVNRGGLACAHIHDTLCVSFATKELWLQTEIELVKSHVESDEDEMVNIGNLSQAAHCNHHRTTLEALLDDPKTIDELLQFACLLNAKYRYKVVFSPPAMTQLQTLLLGSPELLTRIYELVKSMKKTPLEGIGKPEKLKNELSGLASRRITGEHRLVYCVQEGQTISIARSIGHYG